MLDIKKLAQKQTQLAELMNNREKGETEELIGKTATITDCEPCVLTKEDGSEEQVWVYIVKEEPKKFFFAGFVLAKIFNSFMEATQGDIEEVRQSVRENYLSVKYGQKKTKDGKKTVTTIEVV